MKPKILAFYRSLANQEDGKQLLDQIEFLHSQAKEAVTLGDGTIKEANNTYYTLAGKLTSVLIIMHKNLDRVLKLIYRFLIRFPKSSEPIIRNG